jgi:acylphosphatase
VITHYEIKVTGRVQGVGFRYAARNQARELGLKGWVENRPDGSVHVAVQGDRASCNAFINWCRKGTGYSWVERVEYDERPLGAYDEFTVRH